MTGVVKMPSVYLKRFKNFYKSNDLLVKIIGGVLIGVIAGLLLRKYDLSKETKTYIGFPGLLFLNGLNLLVLPFIACCIIIGTTKLNISKNGNIALKVLVIFFLTSLFNVILGTTLGLLFRPGDGMVVDSEIKVNKTEQCVREGVTIIDSFMDLGRNLVPDNFFLIGSEQMATESCLKGDNTINRIKVVNRKTHSPNTLGLTLFCLVFGGILGSMTEHQDLLLSIITALYEIIQKMLFIVVGFTPICVPCIICQKLLEAKDIETTFRSLGTFAAIFISGLIFYQLVVLQILYFLIIRKNPFKYYLGLIPAMVTAFATASKAVTLPITMKCMADLRQNKRLSQFILPLGSMNLNGSAQFMALALVFIAQMEKVSLNSGSIITLIITTTFASMSSAGIPSAATAMVIVLCSILQIPPENATLLYTIDWLMDRFRTPVNILGDCYTEAFVEKISSKQLQFEDENVYPTEITTGCNTSVTNIQDITQ